MGTLERITEHKLTRREVLTLLVVSPLVRSLHAQDSAVRQEIPKVAIFAGHVEIPIPPNDGRGSLSVSGIPEYRFNDELVANFSSLQHGAIEYMPGYAIQNIPFTQRPELAKKNGAGIYIEIHHDSAQDKDIKRLQQGEQNQERWNELSGFSVIYNSSNNHSHGSLRLAQLVAEELFKIGFKPNLYHAKDIDGERRPLVDSTRAIYTGREYVLREGLVPSIIVETGVITNPFEEIVLRQPKTRKKIAQSIDVAVTNYFTEQRR